MAWCSVKKSKGTTLTKGSKSISILGTHFPVSYIQFHLYGKDKSMLVPNQSSPRSKVESCNRTIAYSSHGLLRCDTMY
jgi:hypothetical protein